MHMTSKRFLSFDEQGLATLVSEASQDTLFEFWPLLHEPSTTHVHYNQTIRMNHKTTGGWVQSAAGKHVLKTFFIGKQPIKINSTCKMNAFNVKTLSYYFK